MCWLKGNQHNEINQGSIGEEDTNTMKYWREIKEVLVKEILIL